MKLPVDTSAIAFLCALEPQPLLAFDTKQQRADENGELLFVVQLIALAEGEAEILAVKVPGMPSGIRQGHPVKVHRPALDHAGPHRGRLPRRPHRAGRLDRQGELRKEAMPNTRP